MPALYDQDSEPTWHGTAPPPDPADEQLPDPQHADPGSEAETDNPQDLGHQNDP